MLTDDNGSELGSVAFGEAEVSGQGRVDGSLVDVALEHRRAQRDDAEEEAFAHQREQRAGHTPKMGRMQQLTLYQSFFVVHVVRYKQAEFPPM